MTDITLSLNAYEATRPIPLPNGVWNLFASGQVYTKIGTLRKKGIRRAMGISIVLKPISETSGVEIDNMEAILERGQTFYEEELGRFDAWNREEGPDMSDVVKSVGTLLKKLERIVPPTKLDAFRSHVWGLKTLPGRSDEEKDKEFVVVDFDALRDYLEGGTISDAPVVTREWQDNTFSRVDTANFRL